MPNNVLTRFSPLVSHEDKTPFLLKSCFVLLYWNTECYWSETNCMVIVLTSQEHQSHVGGCCVKSFVSLLITQVNKWLLWFALVSCLMKDFVKQRSAMCAIFAQSLQELLCTLNKTFNNLILSFMEGNRCRLDLSAPTLTSMMWY